MQGEIRFLLFNHGSISDATDIEKHECVFEENLSFNMVGLPVSSKLDWGSYIVSVAETASKKIGTLVHCIKFLSLRLVLYRYEIYCLT